MSRKPVIFLVGIILLLLIPLKGRIQSGDHPAKSITPEPVDQPICQYDGIIKAVADSVGLDWRFVAAVIYHESRFHNQANSHKGAVGLMQVLSPRYSQEYLLDPESNLRVGCKYLKRLQEMYADVAASPIESLKFALAAYNYGETKVWKLINQTRQAAQDPGRWDVVATHLPQGHHTVTYVNKVLDTYTYYYTRY